MIGDDVVTVVEKLVRLGVDTEKETNASLVWDESGICEDPLARCAIDGCFPLR